MESHPILAQYKIAKHYEITRAKFFGFLMKCSPVFDENLKNVYKKQMLYGSLFAWRKKNNDTDLFINYKNLSLTEQKFAARSPNQDDLKLSMIC